MQAVRQFEIPCRADSTISKKIQYCFRQNHPKASINTIQQFFIFKQNLKESRTDFALLRSEEVIERKYFENNNYKSKLKLQNCECFYDVCIK